MLMELPLGFGMALAQNEAAMKRFEALSEAEKQEMRQLIAGLCNPGGTQA